MSGHECQQFEKFMEIANFTGKIEQAVTDIRSDIDGLGDTIRGLSKCVRDTKLDVTRMKVKFGFVGIGVGIIGSAVVQGTMKLIFNKMM